MTVACTVTLRFAHTVMATKAVNRGNSSQEIFFEVELPKTAFITNFSMSAPNKTTTMLLVVIHVHLLLSSIVFVCQREIDGQVYTGAVKEKEKARKEYEKAVSSGKTAGLVKYVALNSSNIDIIALNVPVKSPISVFTGLLAERWRSSQFQSTLPLNRA